MKKDLKEESNEFLEKNVQIKRRTAMEIMKIMEDNVRNIRESVLFLDKEKNKWQIEDINEFADLIESNLYVLLIKM